MNNQLCHLSWTLLYQNQRGLIPQNRIEMPVAWKAIVKDGKVKFWQGHADWCVRIKIIEEDQKSNSES